MGSVVMPYIMSSTLRRMSTISTVSSTSSGLSSGSASSDGPAHPESVETEQMRRLLGQDGPDQRPDRPEPSCLQQRSQDVPSVSLGGGQPDRQEEPEGVERQQVPGPAGEAAGRR